MTQYNQRCLASLLLVVSIMGNARAAVPEAGFSIKSCFTYMAALGAASFAGLKAYKFISSWQRRAPGVAPQDISQQVVNPLQPTNQIVARNVQHVPVGEHVDLERVRKEMLNAISGSTTMRRLKYAIEPLAFKTGKYRDIDESCFCSAIRDQVCELAHIQASKILQGAEEESKHVYGFLSPKQYLRDIAKLMHVNVSFVFDLCRDNVLRLRELGFDGNVFNEELRNACDIQVRRKIEEVLGAMVRNIESCDLDNLQLAKTMLQKSQDQLVTLKFARSVDFTEESCRAIDKVSYRLLDEAAENCQLGLISLQSYWEKAHLMWKAIDDRKIDDKLRANERSIVKGTLERSLKKILAEPRRCFFLKNRAVDVVDLRKIFEEEGRGVEQKLTSSFYSDWQTFPAEINASFTKHIRKVWNYVDAIQEATLETQVNFVEQRFKKLADVKPFYRGTDIAFIMANHVVKFLLNNPLPKVESDMLLSLKTRRTNLFMVKCAEDELFSVFERRRKHEVSSEQYQRLTEIIPQKIKHIVQMLHGASNDGRRIPHNNDPYVKAYYKTLQKKDYWRNYIPSVNI